eukprot:TRINITY_DN31892_c0_g1_i1.p1 TRINITY_DN31892_c0_g1~~TRINITY_DN31892_c0_g1_i1.p1  ORF type:complete len:448 (+),score=95.22 TRINITY_DN31892_c0_g1_i1:74-1345(+)
MAAASHAVSVYAYDGSVSPRPWLSIGGGLQGCCDGRAYTVLVSATGEVYCAGTENGPQEMVRSLEHCPLPWPASHAVSGADFWVVAQAGGRALASWGENDCGQLGREGADESSPAGEIPGLPPDDPVVLLAAGNEHVLAITAGDAAYGWGDNAFGTLAHFGDDVQAGAPVRIAALCGRGVRAIACGQYHSVAETAAGELLGWGGGGRPSDFFLEDDQYAPVVLGVAGAQFPLRALAAGGNIAAAADAVGAVWLWRRAVSVSQAELPAGEPAMQVAASSDRIVVALTEAGVLWDCSDPTACRSISGADPELPLGLVPCSSASGYLLLATLSSPGLLHAQGRDFTSADASRHLSDCGLSAESQVELLRAPSGGVQPAEEGPLVLFVSAPMLGIAEPVCLEVAADATVGGLAALAALRFGAARAEG